MLQPIFDIQKFDVTGVYQYCPRCQLFESGYTGQGGAILARLPLSLMGLGLHTRSVALQVAQRPDDDMPTVGVGTGMIAASPGML